MISKMVSQMVSDLLFENNTHPPPSQGTLAPMVYHWGTIQNQTILRFILHNIILITPLSQTLSCNAARMPWQKNTTSYQTGTSMIILLERVARRRSPNHPSTHLNSFPILGAAPLIVIITRSSSLPIPEHVQGSKQNLKYSNFFLEVLLRRTTFCHVRQSDYHSAQRGNK